MSLAVCIHFGAETPIDGLLPTTIQIATKILVPTGENKTSKPEGGPSLAFSSPWEIEISGSYL